MASITINTPADFNFKECLRFLNRSAKESLHLVNGDGAEKALSFDGEVVIFRIHEVDQLLTATILKGEVDAEKKSLIQAYVTEWLDLDRDLSGFYSMAKNDKILAPIVERFKGLRLIGFPGLFESLVWSVIGQQINLSFAYTLKRRFVETFGQRILHDDKEFFILPSPAEIAHLPPSELEKLRMTKRKAEYIVGIAKVLASSQITKAKLQAMTLEKGLEELIKIRGIGAWTANYVLMKCIRHPAAFPIADVGLHNALKQALDLPAKPSIPEIKNLAKSWTGMESYATFYLWHSLL